MTTTLTETQTATLRHFAERPASFHVSHGGATCAAMTRRGLLERATGPDTGRNLYRVTAAGLAALASK
jgi:hypothetical protein